MRYLRGDLTLAETLKTAGIFADGGLSGFIPEDFYTILTRLENGEATAKGAEEEMMSILKSRLVLAQQHWAELQAFVSEL